MTMRTRSDTSAVLQALYAERRKAISERLEEFSRVRPEEYFYELCYCLLTPQSRADHAERVVRKLQERDFQRQAFNPEEILSDRLHYIRFHRTKARRLVQLCSMIESVQEVLSRILMPADHRTWLVGHVDGLGLKEATHFLRNVGKNGNLAILDRHILRNLKRYGAIRSIPDSLTPRHYHRIEHRFVRFADAIGIPINHLDLLFWSMETGSIRK